MNIRERLRIVLIFVPVLALACVMLTAMTVAELLRDIDRAASWLANALVDWAHGRAALTKAGPAQ